MTKVGFIGVGTMGLPMATNLAKKGFDVTVFDTAPGRAAEVAKEIGAKPATELSGLGDREFIVTMLPDGNVVREVLTHAEGAALIGACKPGTIFIDMSSSEPLITRETGAKLAEHGLILVDAPVSGARPRAETGTLALMIGTSDEAVLAKVRPVLEAMGNQLFVMGGLGNGHAMKALNNYIGATNTVAVSEALVIGEEFGLDPSTMVDVLNASTGKSFVTEFVMKQHVISGKFATGFAIGLLAKDARIAADLAEEIHLDAPLSRLVRERMAYARDHVGPTHDNAEAYLAFKDQAKKSK